MSRLSEARQPGIPARRVALLAVALAALNMYRFADLSCAVDDSWISFRVARTLLDTGKLTYDAAMPPVEGMTNLLWTLLSVLWVKLPVDPIGPARLIGAICHLLTVGVLSQSAADLAARLGGRPAIAAGVTGVLLATSGTLAFNAISGLETSFYGILVAFALTRLTRGNYALGGLCLGLAAATRPEGVLLGGLVLSGLVASRQPRAAVFGAAVPFGLVVLCLEVFRRAYYGQWVPNTFFAKPPGLGLGLEYVASGVLWGTGLFGLFGLLPVAGRSRAAACAAAALPLLLAATAWSGGDWMPGARRLTEVFLIAAPLLGISVAIAENVLQRLTAGVAALAWAAGSFSAAITGWDSARFDHERVAAMGQAAARSAGVNSVALADIGRFGWEFPGSIFDVVGLTDAHIARLDGPHGEKAWDEEYFRRRNPDLVLIRCETRITDPLSVEPSIPDGERALMISILDHGGYRYHGQYPLSPGHWILVFPRDGLVLDPRLWGPQSPRDLRDILIDQQ